MARSMKAVFTSVIIVCLLVSSLPAAPPQPPAASSSPSQKAPGPTPPTHTVGKPDLVVDLSLVTEKSNAPDAPGVTCYRVMPRYTITNIGQAPAAGFSAKLEDKPSPGAGWHLYASHNLTLNPGQSFTVEPNVNTMISWCEGYGYKAVGFRVTADDGNIIDESREGNNTAEKLFPSMPIPGLKPELIEKKGR